MPDQHSDLCISYVEESLRGRGSKLHTILFNVDDYDSNGAIAGRWSNITATSDLFRTMAHVTGGRFHWFRETGKLNACVIRNVLLVTEVFFVMYKYLFRLLRSEFFAISVCALTLKQ